MNKDELYDLLQKRFNKKTSISPSTLPEIALYMDQVTTFMEDKLKTQRRHQEDKILTKTMVNNYTKNHLLPPPTKKKYNQDHLLTLIYTYYLKNVLTISDIKTLIGPMIENYWTPSEEVSGQKHSPSLTMKDIYESILLLEPTTMQGTMDDVCRKLDTVEDLFSGDEIPSEDQDYLEKFTFCVLLALDIYIKKQMLEDIIDDMK